MGDLQEFESKFEKFLLIDIFFIESLISDLLNGRIRSVRYRT